MPPGKGFYGPKYREKRSGDRKLAPFALLAGVPVLAFLAWIGACAFGGGGAGEAPAEGCSGETLTTTAARPSPWRRCSSTKASGSS